MTRLALAALAMFVLFAPAASAAVYRDRDEGVEVRVKGGIATVDFTDTACGDGSLRTMVRARRIDRSVKFYCEIDTELVSKTVRVKAKVRRRRVVGSVGDQRFKARRGAPKPSAAQRCGHTGLTVATTDTVRVYQLSDVEDSTVTLWTTACRLGDGRSTVIASVSGNESGDLDGTRARYVQAVGSRIAYSQELRVGNPRDGESVPTVVVRDLEAGTESTVDPELESVYAVALHPDGRVAWAGTDSYSERPPFRGDPPPPDPAVDVHVKTVTDGKVVTLDSGPIVPSSLRAEGDGFAWDRR